MAWTGAQGAVLQVPPRVEGAYELAKRDARRPPFQISQPLIIMNTLTSHGVIISFSDKGMGHPKYVFRALTVAENGYSLEGVSIDNDLAEIRVEIDPETRNVTAWVRDPKQGQDFVVQGEQRFSTAPYFRAPGRPIAPKYLEGRFVPPTYIGDESQLFINKSAVQPEQWLSQFVTRAGSRVNFPVVSVDLARRNVQMVDIGARHFTKWIFAVAVNEDSEEVTLIGMRFDAAWGRTPGLTFVKR